MRFVLLILLVACWCLPASADPELFEMHGRLDVVTNPDGSTTVNLLAGGPLGLGGIAAGRVTDTATTEALWLAGSDEVSGIEPTPFFPAGSGDTSGVEPTPFAPEDARVLSFDFDRTGAFSGIQPTPFKVFLATPEGYLGELLFDAATAETGSLILTGVELDTGSGVVTIPVFTIEALVAAPALSPILLPVLVGLMAAAGLRVVRSASA